MPAHADDVRATATIAQAPPMDRAGRTAREQ